MARAVAFAVPAALTIYYALRGGSYDIVVRQEETLAVWWVLGIGFALGLFPRVRPPRGALVPLAGVGLLAAWTAISLIWTDSSDRTLAEVNRVLHFGGLLALVWCLLGRRTWRPAVAGLTFGAIVVCGLAVGSRLFPDAFPENEVARVFRLDRLNYPFNYWNALAAWGAMSIAMVLPWSAHARTTYVRSVSLAVLPLCALAIYLTYSRQGVAGAALAIVLVLALSRNRWTVAIHAAVAAAASAIPILVARDQPEIANATGGGGAGAVLLALLGAAAICVLAVGATRLLQADRLRAPRPWGRVAVASAAVAVLLIAAVPARGSIGDAWEEFSEEKSPGRTADPAARLTSFSSTRIGEWRSTLDAFSEHPVRGTGAGTFEFWWNQDGGEEYVRDAHSLYLEQLSDLGAPGLLLTLLMIGGIVVVALLGRVRLARPSDVGAHAAALAAFLVFLFHAGIDWMWESTAVAALAIAAGAIAGSAGTTRRMLPGPLMRVGVAVFAAGVCLLQLPGLVSSSSIRDSQDAFRKGDLATARADADEAVDAQPWAASPYVQRGLVAEEAGDLPLARASLRQAIEREPTNWRHPLLLARIEAQRGRPRLALTQYRRAKALRPEAHIFRILEFQAEHRRRLRRQRQAGR